MPYGNNQESEKDETILGGSKRTSFVNDNKWWGKLKEGFNSLSSYEPKKLVRSMEFREGLSKNKEDKTRPFRGPGLLSRVEIGEKAWAKERQTFTGNATEDPWNARLKKSDNASGY